MNINKPEIKKYFFLTIICHKLQTIFFLSLTLIHTNSQFGCSICGRPKLIRQCQNCFGIVPEKYKLPSLVLFFLYFNVENCLSELFSIICGSIPILHSSFRPGESLHSHYQTPHSARWTLAGLRACVGCCLSRDALTLFFSVLLKRHLPNFVICVTQDIIGAYMNISSIRFIIHEKIKRSKLYYF